MPRLIGLRERSHQPVWETLPPKLSWRSRVYRFVLLKLLPDRLRWRWLMKRRIRLLSTIEGELNREHVLANHASTDDQLVYMLGGIQRRDVQ